MKKGRKQGCKKMTEAKFKKLTQEIVKLKNDPTFMKEVDALIKET